MNKDMSVVDQSKCQVHRLEESIRREKNTEIVKLPLRHRLRLALRRSFSPSAKRKIKGYFDRLIVLFSSQAGNKDASYVNPATMMPIEFNSGDRVLVRSKEQIQLTLNSWNELKGCSFLPEMWQYCGTLQKVFKPVKRFVDERDCRVKKVKGVYLLEGVNCQGFELYGECDRACFYFWREEWLEKVKE